MFQAVPVMTDRNLRTLGVSAPRRSEGTISWMFAETLGILRSSLILRLEAVFSASFLPSLIKSINAQTFTRNQRAEEASKLAPKAELLVKDERTTVRILLLPQTGTGRVI